MKGEGDISLLLCVKTACIVMFVIYSGMWPYYNLNKDLGFHLQVWQHSYVITKEQLKELNSNKDDAGCLAC